MKSRMKLQQPNMTHRQLFGYSRRQALERRHLLDITPVARQALMEVPLAITPALWRSVARDDPFRIEDPRLLSLCFATFMSLTGPSTREEFSPFCHTVWFEAAVSGQRVSLKLMTHPGDGPGPVMTLLTAEEKGLSELDAGRVSAS
jgi:hypothetical protein